MNASLVLGAAVAALLPAFAAPASPAMAGSSPDREAADVRLPPIASAGQLVLYGHVSSLTRRAGRFELRFDPAWWLTGVAAERAAADDGAIRPGEPVPNDYYVVDEGHRLLAFVVSAGARVTVLTSSAVGTRITVSELAQLVAGRNPRHRRLLEPKAGYWIRVGGRYPNPVVSLDQQYQP
jgi:hypothetical protein